MLRGGLKVVDLPGESVLRAQRIARELPHLSVHDCFAYVLAESRQDCVLLTGDRQLRRFARKQRIEVHGVLWVIDELHAHAISTAAALVAALKALKEDPTVRLPQQELAEYLERYGRS